MTREKAIEKIKEHKCHIDGQDKCQWVTEGFGNCDDCEIGVAIKALEQEPILDKIRAEIEQEPYVSKMEVLDIIDKYKAESEDEINDTRKSKRN